jgi:hypothetical protein
MMTQSWIVAATVASDDPADQQGQRENRRSTAPRAAP